MPLMPNLIERQLIKRQIIPGLLLDLGISTFKQATLIAAIETGVLDILKQGPMDLDGLSEQTGASEEGLQNLLRALEPLGYVETVDGIYHLTSAARRGLPDEDMQTMLPFFKEQIRHMALDAATAVRQAPEDGIYGWERVQSGDEGRAYQEAMRWLASDLVDDVVDKIDLPDGAGRVLDVGGSHGLYTVRFCRTHPDLEGTIIDWEIGLENARKTLEDHPDMADRIELLEVDFEEEELPTGYDLAFLGQIIHGISPDGNQALFEKLARATTDKGTVAILDQFEDPPKKGWLPFDPTSSAFGDGIAALLGFNLFLFSGGRSYRYDDVATWLAEAGFPEVSHIPLPKSPGYSLIVARK